MVMVTSIAALILTVVGWILGFIVGAVVFSERKHNR